MHHIMVQTMNFDVGCSNFSEPFMWRGTNIIKCLMLFQTRWPGIDGIQGPMLSGTGYYMKREALYGKFLQKGRYIILIN